METEREGRKTTELYLFCSVCGQPCALELCVIDEHGRSVHEQCYANKVTERLARGA